MNDVEIRTVTADELPAWLRSLQVTFLELQEIRPVSFDWMRRSWDLSRAWGAFDDGRPVATLRTEPRQLAVPGLDGSTLDLTADALTMVTVNATHRRRGILREMLTRSLDAAAGRGDAVSILIAAEWPIYGRFGYAPALRWGRARIDRRRPGAALLEPTPGTLRHLDDDRVGDVLPAVFEASRRQRAGQIDRPASWWTRHFDPELRDPSEPRPVVVVHDGPDGPDGAVVWHVDKPEKDADGGVFVDDLFATNQQAYRALWTYVFGLDLVEEVTLGNRPVDDPMPHLLLDARTVSRRDGDGMWLRILDVPKALSARRYAVPGRLVMDVSDTDVGGFAAGRFVLEADGDSVACRPDPGATPDLRLTQRALASAYLGAPGLGVSQVVGDVTELTAGALGRADAMFRTALQPWLATSF